MLLSSLLLVSLSSVTVGQVADGTKDDPFFQRDPFASHLLSNPGAQDGGAATNDPFTQSDPLAIVRPASINKVASQTNGDLLSVSSEVVLPDSISNMSKWIDPMRRWEWKREDSLNVPVTGPLSVYGQMNAGSSEVYTTDTQLAGKTGLACKVPVGIAEFQVKSGPSWTFTDPLRPLLTKERAEWQMELQARCPLVWGVGLEYQGQALPALSPMDRDRFNQDIHLAFPICTGGKLNLGAKQSWEAFNGQTIQSSDSSQIYLGVQLTR